MAEESSYVRDKGDKSKYENGQHPVMDVAARGLGIRHLQGGVFAIASFVAFSIRISLSVAVVAMIRYDKNETSTEPELAPTFDWGEKTQGYVLSSFFWGYMILQIPAGIITEKFGGQRFLCFAVIGSSLLTLLVPVCALVGDWYLLCINRMCQGICQGFLFPSIYTLLGLWCPQHEISRITGISLSAQFFGMVLTTPMCGYLAKLYGWPSVFYTIGGFGLALGVVMIILGADSPAKHKWISEGEKQYIENSRGGAKVKRSIPWKSVLTSVPYLVALLNMTCFTLGGFIMLTKVPTYLATVLKFSIEDNGVLTALPFLTGGILCFVYSNACDFITSRKLMSITAARKVFNSIAHFGSAVTIVSISYVEDRTWSVVLICACVGCQAAALLGCQANFVELAPNFSGTLYGLANFTSAIAGFSGPILIGFVVTQAGSIVQWRIVFYLCAFLLVLSNCVYLFVNCSETQWWNWPEKCSGKDDVKDLELPVMNEYLRRRSFPRLSLT